MSFEGLRTNNHAIWRRIAFAIISLLILLPPAIPIVFGNKVHWIKGWQMYHDAGLGLLKGEFAIYRGEIVIKRLSPLQVIDLQRYPFVKGISAKFTEVVHARADLKTYAAELCSKMAADERLAYAGLASTHDGWINVDSDDVCGGTP